MKNKLAFLYEGHEPINFNSKMSEVISNLHSLLFYYNNKHQKINKSEFDRIASKNKKIQMVPILCGPYIIGWQHN